MIFSCLPVGALLAENRVITKQFDWQVHETEHFDIYFYDEGRNIVPLFAEMLEKTCRRAALEYDTDFKEKMPIFLFVGHNDFEQTNVTYIGEGTGGVTEAYKNRLVLYYSGSKYMLQYLVEHEFTHETEFNVLFSGFWKSAKLIKFPLYPNWTMEGLAEYNTRELAATERDMYLRDAVNGGKLIPLGQLHNFGHVKPHQVTLAYKQSNAFMQFIADEYGREKPSAILKALRDKFDPNLALMETAGAPLNVMEKKYREYLEDKYSLAGSGMEEPEKYGKKVTIPKVYYEFNTNPVFFDNGRKIAYLTDRNGPEEVVLQGLESGDVETVAGEKDFDVIENISSSGRGLSADLAGKRLLFTGEKAQKDYLYLYDSGTGKTGRIETGFDIINSACLSPDGNKILFIALQSGYSGIYTCDTNGANAVKVFGDFNDVSDAVFSNDSSFIVFSKEVKTSDKGKPYQRDLYKLDLLTDATTQLTDYNGDEISPCVSTDNETVIFVSDKDGVNDLYSLGLKTGEVKKLTSVIGGNYDPAFSPDGSRIAFSSFRKGSRHIYVSGAGAFENKPVIYSKPGGDAPLVQKPFPGPFTYNPYRFSASTDLFFPFLYYSTYDGLFIAMYWQISEMLGNHTALLYTQYSSGADFLDYSLEYAYTKYRPQLFFRLQGQGSYIDWYGYLHRSVHAQLTGVSYPLNRYNSVSFALQNALVTEIDRTDPDNVIKTITNEHAYQVGYSRDTAVRKYIQVTRGSRLGLTCQFGTDAYGADYIYQDTVFEYNKFFPLGKEHALYLSKKR